MPCRRAVLTCLLLATLSGAEARADPPPADEVNRALGRVFEDERYQRRFPDEEPPDGEGTAAGSGSRRPERTRRGASDAAPRRAGDRGALQVLAWALLAAVVIACIVALVRRLGGYQADVAIAEPKAPDGPPADAGKAAVAPDEAGGLAAAGRHAEAIHALLMAAMTRLAGRVTLAGSLTSREVLDRARLADAPREALGALVDAVELTVFGGRAAGAAEYGEAAAQYERFRKTFARARA
jgi:hypothetical protein